MTPSDMDDLIEAFVAATRRAEAAGFDCVELHCGHGNLLSSFLTPVLNHRTDEYGGDLAHRMRFPLAVLDAVRATLPASKPLFVRISATDWVEEGLSDEDAVEMSRIFAEHGADVIDVSTGETSPAARPQYGRSYQTPFADRIRNIAGVTTMAVGAISSWDDVNSNIAAGRSDLCALGRPHLFDPSWTLHAAAEQGYAAPWPASRQAGSARPPAGRAEDPKPRLELRPAEKVTNRPRRWQP